MASGLPVSKRTGVSAEDIREKWHSTAQVRSMKKKGRLVTHKAGIGNTNAVNGPLSGSAKGTLQIRGIQKAKKQKKRAKPVLPAAINAQLDKHMQHDKEWAGKTLRCLL